MRSCLLFSTYYKTFTDSAAELTLNRYPVKGKKVVYLSHFEKMEVMSDISGKMIKSSNSERYHSTEIQQLWIEAEKELELLGEGGKHVAKEGIVWEEELKEDI